jgi:cytochrome c oxidase cbb3-type subunit 3
MRRRIGRGTWRAEAVLLAAGAALACQREARDLHPNQAVSAASQGVAVSALSPGPAPPAVRATLAADQNNAYAMNEGKRLFESYNCTGCHAHGGGAIGPALMDQVWIYGSDPENVFATIVEGRPNGMPSFRGKVPDYQVAELAAYVRSMSGQTGKAAAPGRDDAMNAGPAENTRDRSPPLRGEGQPPP